jgi:hypothetical protein
MHGKFCVHERVIFGLHGEALDVWNEAWALGNRPAQKKAIEPETKIVTQVARSVFLHDEREPTSGVNCAPRGSFVRPELRFFL